MKVLHVAGAFAQHPLYPQLLAHLGDFVDRQFVYAPVRTAREAAQEPLPRNETIDYELSHILRRRHRLLFRTKIRMICRALKRRVDPSDFDVVHAHTLYSDGAVAWSLNKSFGLPYVIAVRNTDMNFFMRWRPDLLATGRRVLDGAEKVIFLSPSYRAALLDRLPPGLGDAVARKSAVVPNGLGETWYEPVARGSRSEGPLRLLYVGNASANKNIGTTLRAAALLSRRVPLRLTLVGSGREQAQMQKWLERHAFARHLGRIDDPVQLRQVYREHDIFVMPSFRETFGVVYIEALSQGVPVVHSRGQGVDGFFEPGTVSEAVDPGSAESVASGIEAIARRLENVRPAAIRVAARFSWREIATAYAGIYAEAERSANESMRPVPAGEG